MDKGCFVGGKWMWGFAARSGWLELGIASRGLFLR